MRIRFVLIAVGLVACAEPGPDPGSDLHALPPAPAGCALSLGADAILVDDAMTVCVPGAYCPPGYAAGEVYRDYSSRVPRWIPRVPRVSTNTGCSNAGDSSPFSWRQTLFSERGTLIAIGAGFLLLWLKRTLLSG